MISHITHVFESVEVLDDLLRQGAVPEAAKAAQSILVQVYCAKINTTHIREVTGCLCEPLP